MNIEEILVKADELSPAPQILPQLLNLLNDMDSDPFEIVGLIRMDAPLTARVLKLSNSAYYGMSTQSASIEEAVNRIGFTEVYKLVAVICSSEFLSGSLDSLYIEPGKLWEHSLACAFIMEAMAREKDESETTAYTIGLLHAMGKTLINSFVDGVYKHVFELVESDQVPLIEAEHEVLGFNHADLGAALLAKWKFPAEITEPIELQYRPLASVRYPKLTAMTHLANGVAAGIGAAAGRDAFAMEMIPGAAERIDATAEDFERYLIHAHSKIEDIGKMIKIAAPSDSPTS